MATCLTAASNGLVAYELNQQSCLFYAVDAETWAKLQEVISPTLTIDYVQLAAVWSFFCAFTVSLFLFSRGCNHVLEAIRKS